MIYGLKVDFLKKRMLKVRFCWADDDLKTLHVEANKQVC